MRSSKHPSDPLKISQTKLQTMNLSLDLLISWFAWLLVHFEPRIGNNTLKNGIPWYCLKRDRYMGKGIEMYFQQVTDWHFPSCQALILQVLNFMSNVKLTNSIQLYNPKVKCTQVNIYNNLHFIEQGLFLVFLQVC